MNEVLSLQGMEVGHQPDFDAPGVAMDGTNPGETVMTSILTIVMR